MLLLDLPKVQGICFCLSVRPSVLMFVYREDSKRMVKKVLRIGIFEHFSTANC